MNLSDIITHAYNTVPYYNQLFKRKGISPETICDKNDLARIPVLTKDLLRENTSILLSNKYTTDELLLEKTSGTTGVPLSIYKSRADQIAANYAMARFRLREFGITPSSKLCYFYMFSRDSNNQLTIKSIIKKGNCLSLNIFASDLRSLENYYQEISRFKPDYILSIPSYLFILAKYIKENNYRINWRIKCIELKGEFLFKAQMELISGVFNAPILNHYGTTETYGIAFGCKKGKMHILDDNVVVEILDKNLNPVTPGNEGRVYVTSLNNTAMPLIRYELDDSAILYNECSCECGQRSGCIKLLSGRVTEYITLPAGEKLNSGILYYAMEQLNYFYKNIVRQFQIIQNKIQEFDVYVVISDNSISNKKIEEMFISSLHNKKLQVAEWRFHYLEELEHLSLKHKYFINNCEHTN